MTIHSTPQTRDPGQAGGRPPLPRGPGDDRFWWVPSTAAVLAAVLVGALITALVALVIGGDEVTPTPTGTGTQAGAPSPTPSATAPSSTPSPSTAPSPSPSSTGAAVAAPFRFQPLWPFTSPAEAVAWQRSSSGGNQPWRLDPGFTAVAFAQDYLGFAEIDTETSRLVRGDEAWIGVGTAGPDGTSTAAVLHLARIGAGADRPWEVVGSRDTDLTLTTPRYGSLVRSPIVAGGVITGVDEALHVQVRTVGRPVLGEVRGVPAGGVEQKWSVTVPFSGGAGRVITVAVSTGGHLREVERFAVTGLRVRP